jgi:hypothetical protein
MFHMFNWNPLSSNALPPFFVQILSVPVVDEKTGQPHAFIDAIDIVTHVADILLEVRPIFSFRPKPAPQIRPFREK